MTLLSWMPVWHRFKGRLPSRGAAPVQPFKSSALEVKAAKPQTFWEEKIFVSYFADSSLEGCPPHPYFPVYWRKYTFWAILGRLKTFSYLKGLCAMLVLPCVECLVDCGVFLVQLLVTGHIPHLPKLHSTCHTVNLTQCRPKYHSMSSLSDCHSMSLSNCHPTTQNVTQCHHLHPFPGRPCNGRQGHLVAFLTPNNFVWVAPLSTFSLRGGGVNLIDD